MKIFDAHFFGGTFLTGLGSAGLITGIVLLLPPTDYGIVGIILITAGVPLMIFGYRLAKGVYPTASKTTIDTLQRAGLLDKNHKK